MWLCLCGCVCVVVCGCVYVYVCGVCVLTRVLCLTVVHVACCACGVCSLVRFVCVCAFDMCSMCVVCGCV